MDSGTSEFFNTLNQTENGAIQNLRNRIALNKIDEKDLFGQGMINTSSSTNFTRRERMGGDPEMSSPATVNDLCYMNKRSLKSYQKRLEMEKIKANIS